MLSVRGFRPTRGLRRVCPICRKVSTFHEYTTEYASHQLQAVLHKIPKFSKTGKAFELGLVQLTKDDMIPEAPAVVLFHGAISNSRIFFSRKVKGLAPFLAKKGFNVFIADLRGRGFSTPTIAEEAGQPGNSVTHGQKEAIQEDIPAFSAAVESISGQATQSWVAHSWGGVLLSSALAFAEMTTIDSMVCLGTKKYIGERYSWEYMYKIMYGWNFACKLLIKRHGYLPAARFGIGMDDETSASHRDCTLWVQNEDNWKDPSDGFDYKAAYEALSHKPPVWHISGINDFVLGNSRDVQRFAELTGQTQKFTILSKANGNSEDYDHNGMIISANAPDDHFGDIANWIKQHSKHR